MVVSSCVGGYNAAQARCFVLGRADEAESRRVECDVSDIVDNVCEPFRTALLFSLLFLIMRFFHSWRHHVLLRRTRTVALACIVRPVDRRTCIRKLDSKMPPSTQRHERLRAVFKPMILECRVTTVRAS